MKTMTALLLGLGLLVQGSAYAADANPADNGSATKVLTSSLTRSEADGALGSQSGAVPCRGNGENCRTVDEVKSCGAYVSSGKQHGYGFAGSKDAAVSRAMEICGASSCQIVVAACED